MRGIDVRDIKTQRKSLDYKFYIICKKAEKDMFYFIETYLLSSEFSNNWSKAKNIIDRNNRLVDIQKQINKIIVKISKESKKLIEYIIRL